MTITLTGFPLTRNEAHAVHGILRELKRRDYADVRDGSILSDLLKRTNVELDQSRNADPQWFGNV